VRVHALNVEVNPKSNFARRMHAVAAIEYAYVDHGVSAGHGTFEDFQSRYGTDMVNDALLTEVAANLLQGKHEFQAIEALSWIAVRNPTSPDALSNLGDAYAETGDTKKASISYKQALAQDPTNERAKAALAALNAKQKQR
jgi:tetratricopeptide (TPR) repeat protein